MAGLPELAARVGAARRHAANARALLGAGALASTNLEAAIVLLDELLAELAEEVRP